ncbi:MAG: wax ester/triacylglycerol synthase family O-acyltransferase [Desulfobacterales bacterium]|nr:wax ester/triacylglycerol synthase family O-acyltransferase [Desulfobacterales bacterium]
MTEPMSNVDNFWLCMDDPTNLMVISGFMEFANPLDFELLCETVENRLLCFERFKKRAKRSSSGIGSPVWELDPHFDILSHIHRVALPAPGDRETLQEMIGDLSATPLDDTKPLWQTHLIENYGEGCALFFRIHHCIADGIALIYVLLSMADTEPNAPQPECKVADKKSSSLSIGSVIKNVKGKIEATQKIGEKAVREVVGAISNPFHFIEMTRTGAKFATDTAGVLAKLALMPQHPANSFKGNLGVRKRAVWTEPMELGDVKVVGRAVQATLNDVLIATVTGALRRYLQKRNDRVNELDLVVAIPVNIRKPGTEFELGNKFSLVFLSLPVHLEDPVLRLREVKRRMDELKRSPDAFVGFQVLNTLGFSPAGVAHKAAQVLANKFTAVLTNVPGPRDPLYFAGEKIKNMMFWVPRSGRVGLGISIFSYDGKVTVGLSTDAGLVPDPEVILEGFEEDFNYLLDLVNTGKVFEEPLVLHDRYKEAQEAKAIKEAEEEGSGELETGT